jgi:hypothetical protein
MNGFQKAWKLLFGQPLNLLDPKTRHAIAVTPLRLPGRDGAARPPRGPRVGLCFTRRLCVDHCNVPGQRCRRVLQSPAGRHPVLQARH